ncbi:PP2C family protein-serine/threonine phosphatase [Actinoplanes sp. M2I2]|uniref:PP2C family protein-serine/threonine phosphatase n=1 Tax=Actinoplanes sp. M2I2 TaxID=1734444 RepID=UPI0020205595|nr:PP2C family protein-serine/threonine phosphatase [Actinoplanes sp. M2I2]
MINPLDAAGPLRAAYLGVDWAAGLGPVSTWSPTLLGAVDLVLNTRNAVTLMWGPDFRLVYNAAYVPMIGDKHPAALGAPAREAFAEIWDEIGPMLESVRAGRGATWTENMKLLMNRHGYLEETYFTFSYSAVRSPAGEIEGIIDIASETTALVIGRRRLELLDRLTERVADVESVPHFLQQVLPVLRDASDDLPGVDLESGPRLGGDSRVRLPLAEGLELVTGLSPHLPDDEDYRGFLRLVASALVLGLNRVASRRTAATERQMAEALQRSLLSHPAQPDHLEVAVRYHPAAEGAWVGGDWYDAFQLPGGRLAVAVGDVTGHDRDAAAAMSQVRNLLRGISYALPVPPGEVLSSLNDAMTGLVVDELATVVLAHIDLATHDMRWSNAGHPPPALLGPDGAARLLQAASEPLLGTHIRTGRTSHEVHLEPGTTVVFYTDGLLERRDRPLDEGFAALLGALTGQSHLSAEEICEHLSDALITESEDDVVLAVVRHQPE